MFSMSPDNNSVEPGILQHFWSQGQGPVEFGKISFEPSKFGKIDLSDLHFKLSDLNPYY